MSWASALERAGLFYFGWRG